MAGGRGVLRGGGSVRSSPVEEIDNSQVLRAEVRFSQFTAGGAAFLTLDCGAICIAN